MNNLERRYHETNSNYSRDTLEELMSEVECPACRGQRLNSAALSVTVGGKNIHEFCCMSIVDALEFVETLTLSEREKLIAQQLLKEIKERLGFLCSVGLEYLNLTR